MPCSAPDGTLTVRLKAPAQDGQANACLLAYLAEVFGVNKNSVALLSGHTAPFKKVSVLDVDEATGQAVVNQACDSPPDIFVSGVLASRLTLTQGQTARFP